LRQWFGNGGAVGITAVIHYIDGDLFDWTAYIGAAPSDIREFKLHETVAKRGDKLGHQEACFFAPDLPSERWKP
jgi:hypothetical protein